MLIITVKWIQAIFIALLGAVKFTQKCSEHYDFVHDWFGFNYSPVSMNLLSEVVLP